MDGPKSGFHLMTRFPLDILADIVFFVPGEDLGRLKMTGSKSLWGRLSLPGVVKSVKLGDDGIRFKSWPAVMNEFPSLVSLRIENGCKQWWSDLGLTIDQLPSTLKNLTLLIKSLPWSSDHFFVSKATSDTIHIGEHLPHLQSLQLWDNKATNFGWVASCPPSLTKLEVHHWKPEIDPPSSLLHFKAVQGMPNVLPPSLESVCGWTYSHYLPALTSLSAGIGMGRLIQPEDVGSLPRSLTELDVCNWTFPSACWPSLPENLQELSFNATNTHCAVTTIVVDPITKDEQLIESCPLELLPKSLTKIHIDGEYDAHIFVAGSSASLFPPHLKSFDAQYLKLAPTAAKQLPSTLTHLNTCNFYDQLSEHLPEGLTSLSFSDALLNPKAIRCLPKSLTTLYSFISTSDSGEHQWFDNTTGKMVPTSLPEYAVHRDYAAYFTSLPTNLTSLSLYYYTMLTDDWVENAKFPNLLSLTLWGTSKLTDYSIPHLNRHLIYLQIYSSGNITGKSFKNLPKGLTELALDSSAFIVDEDIQHLPRTLTNVHIPSATLLTDGCIRDFPRGCKRLTITDNTEITSQCIADLPLVMASYDQALYVAKWSWSYGKVEPRVPGERNS